MNDIRHHVGGQIKHAREQIGMTQIQLAAQTRLTENRIGLIENGYGRQCTIIELCKIATTLDMELGWPFDGFNDKAKTGGAASRRDNVRRQSANYDRIQSRHVKNGIYTFVKEMADAEEASDD